MAWRKVQNNQRFGVIVSLFMMWVFGKCDTGMGDVVVPVWSVATRSWISCFHLGVMPTFRLSIFKSIGLLPARVHHDHEFLETPPEEYYLMNDLILS